MIKKLIPAAAAFLLAIGTANAVDPPPMKEGLWSIHRQTIDNPGGKKSEVNSTICRNHAWDQHADSLAKNIKGCTAPSVSFQGGKYSSKTHCVIAGTVVDSQGTATYQSDTSVHSETHATYTPAMGGISETTMITDQKYVGSCPAGAQPGDVTTNGRTNHLGIH
ncbi:MAG: DUF3617 family protein [Bryobacteraceae bacterium]